MDTGDSTFQLDTARTPLGDYGPDPRSPFGAAYLNLLMTLQAPYLERMRATSPVWDTTADERWRSDTFSPRPEPEGVPAVPAKAPGFEPGMLGRATYVTDPATGMVQDPRTGAWYRPEVAPFLNPFAAATLQAQALGGIDAAVADVSLPRRRPDNAPAAPMAWEEAQVAPALPGEYTPNVVGDPWAGRRSPAENAAPTAAAVAVAPATVASKPTVWDNVVDSAGGILEHTALGAAVKKLFPDIWYGAGENIKGFDDNNRPGGPITAFPEPLVNGANESHSGTDIPSPPPPTPPPGGVPGFPDANGNGIDDRLEMRTAVFPTMPPYNPGIDPEFLYFRPNPNSLGINGYAEGGEVTALDQQDPRLAVIADAEDALANIIEKGKPGPGDEKVLRAFVEQFGDGALRQLYENVRQGLRMRGKGGNKGRMVEGPGGPTSDSIPAMIDGQEPAALSDGEFVLPAAAVQNAGEGDRDLGARRLQELSDQLQALGSAA